jgi:type I restriction enzyme S subunit
MVREKMLLRKRLQYPREWKIVEMNEILEIITNGISMKQNKNGEGYPVTRIETISDGVINYDKVGYVDTSIDKIKKYSLKKGDILFSNINSLKHIAKTARYNNNKELYHGMNLLKLRFDNDVIQNDFIYYRLNSIDAKHFYQRYAKQAVNQASLNQNDVGLYTFPLPPLPEQKKIATILTSVDNAIEKTNEIINKAKEVKKGLMQDLLTKGIGHSEFKEFRLVNKKVSIPNLWKVSELENFITIKNGYSPSKFNFVENGKYPFMKVDDMNYAYKYINNAKLYFDETKYKMAEPYTIIFPKRGAAIKTNKINILIERAYYDTNIMGVRTNNNLETEFLYYFLDYLGLWKFADTTSIPQINNKHIYPLLIPVPPLHEQKKIATIISSVDKKIQKEQEKKEKLEKLKKGLMQKLLTGEKRVKVDTGA